MALMNDLQQDNEGDITKAEEDTLKVTNGESKQGTQVESKNASKGTKEQLIFDNSLELPNATKHKTESSMFNITCSSLTKHQPETVILDSESHKAESSEDEEGEPNSDMISADDLIACMTQKNFNMMT